MNLVFLEASSLFSASFFRINGVNLMHRACIQLLFLIIYLFTGKKQAYVTVFQIFFSEILHKRDIGVTCGCVETTGGPEVPAASPPGGDCRRFIGKRLSRCPFMQLFTGLQPARVTAGSCGCRLSCARYRAANLRCHAHVPARRS